VIVTETGLGSITRGRGDAQSPDVVLEHWGGDAEMLRLRSSLTGGARLAGPLGRARVAARTLSYYDLDWLQIEYPDGAELSAKGPEIVLDGPRRGFLRRRDRLLSASVNELA
jgi:hypothetical protein